MNVDPNANLERQRAVATRIIEILGADEADRGPAGENARKLRAEALRDYANDLAELVGGLDQWMSKGGFAPKDWPGDKNLRAELEKANAYREAVCEAHGKTYSGTSPMDPGPDEDDFDLWAIQDLRRELDASRGMVKMLTEDREAARQHGAEWEKTAFFVGQLRDEDHAAAQKALRDAGVDGSGLASVAGMFARLGAELDAARAKVKTMEAEPSREDLLALLRETVPFLTFDKGRASITVAYVEEQNALKARIRAADLHPPERGSLREAAAAWQGAGASLDAVAAKFQAERDAERAKTKILQAGLKDAADGLMQAQQMFSAICETDSSMDRRKARDRAAERHLLARGVLLQAENLGPAAPEQASPADAAAREREEWKKAAHTAGQYREAERKRAELAENDAYEALGALKSLALVVRQGLANMPDRLHGQDAEVIMESLERAEKVLAPSEPVPERAVDSSRPRNPDLKYPSLGIGGASQFDGEGSIVFVESVADAAAIQAKQKLGPGTFVVPVGPRLGGDRLNGIKEELAGLALECKALPETSFQIRTGFGATTEGREMSELIDSIAPKGVLVRRYAPSQLGRTWATADDERSRGPKR